MTTDSNIYDIDGEILREAGDTEELSIKKKKKRVTSYQEKLKNFGHDYWLVACLPTCTMHNIVK